MDNYATLLNVVADPDSRDEKRLEAAEQMLDQLQNVLENDKKLLEQTLVTFLNHLETTEPQFISERPAQRLRKLMIDVIHRLQGNEIVREHIDRVLKLMFKLFEVDNEENVGIVLRTIIELHKSHKLEFSQEIYAFLETVKNLYSDIDKIHDLNTMFEDKHLVVKDLSDKTVNDLLQIIHMVKTVEVETPPSEAQSSPQQQTTQSPSQTQSTSQATNQQQISQNPTQTTSGSQTSTSGQLSQSQSSASQHGPTKETVTLIPRACRSIRTMAELPIIVVLIYQNYKSQLQPILEQLLPIILGAIAIRTPEHVRQALKNCDSRYDREIYVEFTSAQVKCLSFVAYLVRVYTSQSVIGHLRQLTQGVLALLHDCPHEVVSVRREIIAASKYIFSTNLRDSFIDHLHVLCNEEVLIGTGWTVHETLRPQAYHTILDLISNYKGRVEQVDLIAAINLFARNLHDNTLPPSVQLMSCKAFSHLIHFVTAPLNDENVGPREVAATRDLLMRIIEIYVLKFKNIAVFHLPNIKRRFQMQQAYLQQTSVESHGIPNIGPQTLPVQCVPPGMHRPTVRELQNVGFLEGMGREERSKFDLSSSSIVQYYNILECKQALKSLIFGIKSAIEAIPSYRSADQAAQVLSQQGTRLFQPKETIVLVRLLKYGLETFDIFKLTNSSIPAATIAHAGPTSRHVVAQNSRSKEASELLENFASIFNVLHPLIFQEVFTKMIDFIVDRTRQNHTLSTIVNHIIANKSVSPIFATILSEFLIVRMEEIGSNDDLVLSGLYLRLFKMVFASVTLYPVENEQMLKPLLHSIVNKSVELALSAKEPYNYFLLLRALFRSIGGGTHEQLYTEFLPLLPNLLQGLNSFQSGQHKQYMKDLFTELCLTVPVRLSSLMPYMPTLIYPLVSALNGPQQLVSQGLRTLELCVDNVAPDYLYEILQPVRADLMQGLWKTVRHPNDVIAQNCLRILGKFGGYNRRMLLEPQKLTYIEQKKSTSLHGTTVVVHFPDQKVNINLPIDKAVYVSCETLKAHPDAMQNPEFYKLRSWELIRGFLIANMGNSPEHSQKIREFFSNPNLATAHIPIRRENNYKCQDQVLRNVYQEALVAMMFAASNVDLRPVVTPFMNAIIRHHTMLSIGQHLCTQNSEQGPQGMDPFVLVDALTVVVGHDVKDQSKPGYYVMVMLIETATMLLGSKERACELPLISYLVKNMYELCYARAWFSKVGGCISIRFFTDNMPMAWLFRYLRKFVKALLYVMSDLTGDLSNGAVDMAQTNLDHLLRTCSKQINASSSDDPYLVQAQSKALEEVASHLIREITSQNLSVRTHAMKSIELIAQLQDKSPAKVMEPHFELLKSTLPFLFGPEDRPQTLQTPDRQSQPQQESKVQNIYNLERQPVRAQIGTIHGCTFCTNLEPRVFVIDINRIQHKSYVDQLVKICESDDSTLKRYQCYANVTNLAPVRTAALRALASLHYLKDYENIIFRILFKTTESTCADLQEEAYKCINKFTSNVQIEPEQIKTETKTFFERLQDSKMWDLKSVKRILCLARLFPVIFDETFCASLQEHFQAISQLAIDDLRTPLNQNEQVYQRTGMANEKIKVCAGILELLTLVPTQLKSISSVISMVFKVETAATMETGSPLREPLKSLLRRQPEQTVALLTTERNLHEQQVYRLLKYLLKEDSGKVFRDVLCHPTYYSKLSVLTANKVTITQDDGTQKRQVVLDLRYQAILIISIMIKYDNDWLISRRTLVDNLQIIWTNEDFHNKYNKVETSDYAHWKAPKLLIKCLLNYFQNQTAAGNKDVIELLFQLLRVFTNRNLCDLEFFRTFLEKTVIETYPIEWKREAFTKFVIVFHDPNYPQKLKIKIMQHIIIPSFAHSFEKGLGEVLVGGPPQLDKDDTNNLIHIYLNKIIDPIIDTNRQGDMRIFVSDALRILILQFSSLLVDQAPQHIHETTNRKQGARLKKLVTLAIPCLNNRNCVDPAAKYHGHFLFAHMISKFAIAKRIIILVLTSLLKASNPDARVVVKQALDVLLPAISTRLEDGHATLLKHTKKMIIDEGHMANSLVHMLNLLVRHYRLYYPMRSELIPLMITSIHRLGFNTTGAAIENRKTAVDLCEIIIRWEITRQKDAREFAQQQQQQQIMQQRLQQQLQQQQQSMPQQLQAQQNAGPQQGPVESPRAVPQSSVSEDSTTASPQVQIKQESTSQTTTQATAPQTPSQPSPEKKRPQVDLDPLDPKHVDAILNALLRLACLVNPGPCDVQPSMAYTTCKTLSDRCSALIKKILVPESWSGQPIVGPDGPNLTFSNWMNDLLCSVQNPNCNVGSISGALELLTYMCGIIKQESMIASLKHLTNGIVACTRSTNARIIRSVSNLVQRVMSTFNMQPIDTMFHQTATSTLASNLLGNNLSSGMPGNGSQTPMPPQSSQTAIAPHPDLEPLYSNIQKVITNGLTTYEQGLPQPANNMRDSQVALFSSLMSLKAACINNQTYIDKFMPLLIRVIQKMTKEHTSFPPSVEKSAMSIELLILSLDLVKNRLGTMTPEIRKLFIQQILSNLIESQSSDVKVLKAVVRIVDEWIKQRPRDNMQSGPNVREKTLLLIKLMLFIEKRFPTEPELNSQFLELINYVYRDDELKNSDLTTKLESAFLSGLRCVQPQIRAKFFAIFDGFVKPKLYERLMYIVCAQNWQHIGCHFWIQQCIEFILAIAMNELPISTSDKAGCLPCIPTTADLGSYVASEIETSSSSLMSMLSGDTTTLIPTMEDFDFNANFNDADNLIGFVQRPKSFEEPASKKILQTIVNKQVNFLEDLKKTRTGDLLRALTQLCHMNIDLAKETWINMFPRIWKALNDQQMTLLGREIIPFLGSGAHAYQRDCNPSAIGTFMEAVSRCQPPIQMRPILIKYLGKNHNIWHRAALMLEDSIKDKNLETIYPVPARSNKANQQNPQDFDIITMNSRYTMAEEAVESLSDILELLHEEDLWCGIWQQKAQYPETRNAIRCEQQGLFERAQEYYEMAMDRQRQEFDETCVLKPGLKSENRVWEKHWIRCTKELNQWDSLLEYGSSKACTNPMLVLESAWRVPNWQMMREALILVEQNCPTSAMWRLQLYKGYNFICNRENPNDLKFAGEAFEVGTSYCIQSWKKLPHIITSAHLPLLQAAQQFLELNEAKNMHMAFVGLARSGAHDLRAILKAWPKRLPIMLDDLSYWSDILTWRQHQYQTIVAHFESQTAMGHPVMMTDGGPANVAMQGAHYSAQGIISFGTVARKQGLVDVCLESINRIHTIPSVPIFDCFHKIRQQIKCYLQLPLSQDKAELLDGLDIIDSTHLKYFQKEYVSEFYTYKAIFLSRLKKHDEAGKAFSCAAQLYDAAPKAWSAWGEYLETQFTGTLDSSNYSNRQMDIGVSAITCLLQACKFYPEQKARKYIAKILWLLSYDNPQGDLLEQINRYTGFSRDHGIPPTNWIVWIPQILQCLMLNPESEVMKNLLLVIGKTAPQSVYFPVRTLLHTLRLVIANQPPQQSSVQQHPTTPVLVQQLQQPIKTIPSPGGAVKLSPSPLPSGSPKHPQSPQAAQHIHPTNRIRYATIQRCSEIIRKLYELHPTTISSLDGITDQLAWLRDYSYEEIQRQFQQALKRCYLAAYEHRHNLSEQTVPPQTLNFVRKIVHAFGVAAQGKGTQGGCGFYATTVEFLSQRNQALYQDPDFRQTRVKVTNDFEESLLPTMKLMTLITKLKHWINTLEQKKKLMPTTHLIEDKCRFLSNFSQHTAEVEIPGDALLPKSVLSPYYVRIARFIPQVKVVEKHNTSARRILIRGHNGKVYPYLVLNDSCLSDTRREERVLQLLRLLNPYLVNRKETGRRYLQFTSPKVVAVNPGLRLVEDNVSSLSLIDILKRRINRINKSSGSELDQDTPVREYYDRLIKLQGLCSPSTNRNLTDIYNSIQSRMVPETLLKEWASQTYVNATDYWVFRSQFTYQLAMACFSEHAFLLTSLMPDSMYIHQDTGCISVSFSKFDQHEMNESQSNTNKDSMNKLIPFRLTPNLSEFITKIGITGPLSGALESVARCLTTPQNRLISIFKAILHDEMLFWQKKGQENLDSHTIIEVVNRVVDKMYKRMGELGGTNEEPLDSNAMRLISDATSVSNLSLMDPAWHPWL